MENNEDFILTNWNSHPTWRLFVWPISKWCQSPPRVIVPATLSRDEFRVRYSPPFHITENYAMARIICVFIISKLTQTRMQKLSKGGSFDTAGGLGADQGSQKPLCIWCKILQSTNFQTLHSNFRKALFSITNF